MQRNLEHRLAALEQANPVAGYPKTFFITFMNPGDRKTEIQKLSGTQRDGERQEWERRPDESQDAFKERASIEAHRNAGGIAMLFQCE